MWKRVQLPKVEKCCPVMYEVLTGGDKDGMIEMVEMEFGVSAEDAEHGFGVRFLCLISFRCFFL